MKICGIKYCIGLCCLKPNKIGKKAGRASFIAVHTCIRYARHDILCNKSIPLMHSFSSKCKILIKYCKILNVSPGLIFKGAYIRKGIWVSIKGAYIRGDLYSGAYIRDFTVLMIIKIIIIIIHNIYTGWRLQLIYKRYKNNFYQCLTCQKRKT